MDPNTSAQDVLRCHLCETPVPPLYCDLCHINLCKVCTAEHLLDDSSEHRVVPIKRLWTKTCNHFEQQYKHFCETCGIRICMQCVYTEHRSHNYIDIQKKLKTGKEIIQKDLKELKECIYPKYQEALSKIAQHKTEWKDNSQKLTTILTKHGEAWHREIDTIIKKVQSEIDAFDSEHLADLEKQEDEINHKLSKMSQTIQNMTKLLLSSDICLVSDYQSSNAEFKNLPPQVKISLPVFSSEKIDTESLRKQFGSVSKPFVTEVLTERQPLDKPKIVTVIDTRCVPLVNVAVMNDEEIWMSGDENMMKLYNLRGELLQSVQTKSGLKPQHLVVTRRGDLVYTDYMERSINMKKNNPIQSLITLQGWRPCGMCCTPSGDLLVAMSLGDDTQTKVVRYSDSVEKQTIRWDENGQPLFSYRGTKYLTENRNLDICVADPDAGQVVVVDRTGKLRFRYTGRPSTSIFRFFFSNSASLKFTPHGIATDSQSRILIADCTRIHIVDQAGQFLRCIENCGLSDTLSLCVDSKDNVFVAECDTGRVKKIQYYM